MSANIELNIVGLGDFSDINAKLTALKTQVTALQKSLAGTSLTSDLSSQLNNLNTNFKNAMVASGQFTEQTVKLKTETDNFGNALTTGKLKLTDYFNIIRNQSSQAVTSMKALAVEQTKLQNSIIMQQPGKQGVFSVYTPTQINKVADATKIAANYQNLYNIAVDKGTQSLINWGKNTQWAGRQLTVGMSVPLTIFASNAVKAFDATNGALTQLQKVYGEGLTPPSQNSIDQISNQVLDLGRKMAATTGIAQEFTVGVASSFAAMGKMGSDLTTATEQTIRLAKLGNLTQDVATRGVIGLSNVYKLNQTQLADAVNYFASIQKQTSLSMTDLIESESRVGPIIDQLGGSYRDTAVMILAMKEAGVPAAQAANALKSAFASIIAPTSAATKEFAKFGINVGALKNAGGPVQMIEALQASLKNLSPLVREQLIEKLFGKYQFSRISALLENFNRTGSQTANAIKVAGATSSALQDLANQEMKQATSSPTAQWQIALNTFKADLYPVGQQIVKIGTVLLNFGNKIAKVFEGLPGPLKMLFGILAAGVALSGPVIMLTGLMANFAGYVLKGGFALKNLITGTKTLKEYLTPELIASKNAAQLFQDKMLGDADAATVLNRAVQDLTKSLTEMVAAMNAGAPGGIPSVAGIANGLGMKEQGLERSHLVSAFEPGSAGAQAAMAMFGPEVQARFAPYISGVSNLIAELPSGINQALKEGGVEIDKFIAQWNSRTNKTLFSVGQGGANITDPVIVAATNNLEKQIGARAAEIATATEEQKVTDGILSQATMEVIAANKELATAEGQVARAMAVAATQVGQARLQIPTSVINEGLASGELTMGNGSQVMYAGEDVARKSGNKVRTVNRNPTLKENGYSPYARSASYSLSVDEATAAAGQAIAVNVAKNAETSIAKGAEETLGSMPIVEEKAATGIKGFLGRTLSRVTSGGPASGIALFGAQMAANSILPSTGVGGAAKSAIDAASTGAMIASFIPKISLGAGAGIGLAVTGLIDVFKKASEDARISTNALTQSFQTTAVANQAFGISFKPLSSYDFSKTTDGLDKHIKSVSNNKAAVDALTQAYLNATDQMTKDYIKNLGSQDANGVKFEMQKRYSSDIAAGYTQSQALQNANALMLAAGTSPIVIAQTNAALKNIGANAGTAFINQISLAQQQYTKGSSGPRSTSVPSGVRGGGSDAFARGLANAASGQKAGDAGFLQTQAAVDGLVSSLNNLANSGAKNVTNVITQMSGANKDLALKTINTDQIYQAFANNLNKQAPGLSVYTDKLRKGNGTTLDLIKAGALLTSSLVTQDQVAAALAKGDSGITDLYNKYKDAIAVAQSAANGGTTPPSGSSSNTSTFNPSAAQTAIKKVLEARIRDENIVTKGLNEQLKIYKQQTTEAQRILDYENKRFSLMQDQKTALMSGNYLGAAEAGQAATALGIDFARTTKENQMQNTIDRIQLRADQFSQALADLNDAIANQSHNIDSSISKTANLARLASNASGTGTITVQNNISISGLDNPTSIAAAVASQAQAGTLSGVAAAKSQTNGMNVTTKKPPASQVPAGTKNPLPSLQTLIGGSKK
jgi:TP901 family phage tail tape measure protein